MIALSSSNEERTFYSGPGQLLSRHQSNTNTTSEYFYLAGSVIAQRDVMPGVGEAGDVVQVQYQHTDALGSPVAVNNRAGQVVDRTDWEPFGSAIAKPAYDGIGYTGHLMDAVTALTYMQQRYYDSDLGRFLSVDPVAAHESGDNYNRYSYAYNNPYAFVDNDGRENVLGIVARNVNSNATSARDLKVVAAAQRSVDLSVNAGLQSGDSETMSNLRVWSVTVDPRANAAPQTGGLAETKTTRDSDTKESLSIDTFYSKQILSAAQPAGRDYAITGIETGTGDPALLAIGLHELSNGSKVAGAAAAGLAKERATTEKALPIIHSSPDVPAGKVKSCAKCY